MKNTVNKLASILFFVFYTTSAYAQAYPWQALSQNDAVQMVRTFENDPNLVVTIAATSINSNQSQNASETYTLTTTQNTYLVWSKTPDLFFRSNNFFIIDKTAFYGQPYDISVLRSQVMTQQAAQDIATSFLQAHYSAPQLLSKIEISPHVADKVNVSDPDFIDSYSFQFSQDCGNGITGPADCEIVVDSVKGQIVSYNSTFYPVLVSTIPTLTTDQAMAAAMNGLHVQNGQPGNIESISVTSPDDFGVEQLVYVLNFIGVGPIPDATPTNQAFFAAPSGSFTYSQYDENYVAIVDANTGVIQGWNITLGAANISKKLTTQRLTSVNKLRAQIAKKHEDMNKSLKFLWANKNDRLVYLPLLITSQPYMSANYLCYGAADAKIAMTKGKQVTVKGQDRQVSFNLNSLTYQVNGQPKQMSARPVLINGRCYVPLDMMNAVLPGKFTYEAKAQTVRYDPPHPKQASK